MTPRVLYVSLDGLLEPIGHSQVVRLLLGLSARGIHIDVVSLERSQDLAEPERLERTRQRLEVAGVRWLYETYRRPGGPAVALANVYRLRALARRAGVSAGSLLHCRGPLPALVASSLPGRWVFDFRGYVIDERLEAGRWFGNPLVLRLARAVERHLFRSASAAVSLTALAAQDVRAGRFGHWPAEKPLLVVPTCADYREFSVPRRGGEIPAGPRQRLEGRCVVGLIGSLNPSYRTGEALRLFRRVLERRGDAHLVCLTRQQAELARLLDEEGIPESARTLTTSSPDAMPQWLSHVDWGLHLLEPSPAKRASMPTKLAEFFAAGVRPIHYGCNTEVADWVGRAGSGIVLDGIAAGDLDQAAQRVAEAPASPEILRAARERTRPHFDLEAGVSRYEALLKGLLSGAALSSPHTPEGR